MENTKSEVIWTDAHRSIETALVCGFDISYEVAHLIVERIDRETNATSRRLQDQREFDEWMGR